MKNFHIADVQDCNEWNDFVDSSPQGTVFSKWEPMQAFASLHAGEARFLGVIDAAGRLTAGVSFVQITKGPFRKAVTPILAPYGGFMYCASSRMRGSESHDNASAELLIKKLSGSYDHILLVHSPDMMDIRNFIWAGWNERVRYTYVLDVENTEIVWKMMEHRTRKQINHGIETHESGGEISPELFTSLNRSIYKRKGQDYPVEPENAVRAVYNLIKKGFGEIITLKKKGGMEAEAAIVLVQHKTMTYSWFIGVNMEESSKHISSYIYWDAIKRYSGKGRKFDFVGANISPISYFKQGFGGTLTPYYVTEFYRSKTVRLAMNAYTRLKRF